MAFYQGTAMRLKIGTKEIFHEVDCEISASTEFKEVASKDTAFKIVTPGSQTYTISCNTSLLDNDGTTQEDLKGLADIWKAKTSHAVTFTTGVTGDVIFSGTVYVETFTASAANEEFATASYTLKGTGDLTIGVNA